jgi:hypothetical protein
MDAKTSHYLSRLKVIATILVVLFHSHNLLGYASYTEHNPLIRLIQFISATAILIFFAISGYLLFRRDFKWADNMKKKLRSLAIPFLIWNSLWMLVEIAGLLLAPKLFEGPVSNSIMGWFVYWFGIPLVEQPIYAPLWFVQILFLLNLIAPAIRWVIDRFPLWLTVGLLGAIWFIPSPYPLWYNGAQSIVFFTIGGIIARKKIAIPLNWTTKLIALLCGGLLLCCSFFPEITIYCYGARFLLLPACVVFGIGAALWKTPDVSKLMPYSFMIYVLHGKPLSVLQILYAKVVPTSTLTVVAGFFLLPIVTIVLCVLVSVVFKRCLPKLYAIANGSR